MTVANLRRAYSDTQSMQPSEETLKQEALDTLIDETLFQAAAAKDGIIISDEELDTEFNLSLKRREDRMLFDNGYPKIITVKWLSASINP